jgi:predicted PurR-regulated permease PerM
VDPLLGGAVGLLVSIPVAYLVLAIANKVVWRGFNDRFTAVRQLARKRRDGTN